MENPHFQWENSLYMAIFNSFLYVYQRVDDRIHQESHLSVVAVRQGGHVWNSGESDTQRNQWMTQR